jgi:hypothetical protein
MKQSPSYEANSAISWSRNFHILWTPKVHHHFHNIPPLVRIPSQMNPIRTLKYYLPKINLFYHLRLGLPSGLFPSGFCS